MSEITDKWKKLRQEMGNLIVVKHVLKEQEQEFQVGDEVEYSNHRDGSCHKYIVIKADSDSDVLLLLDLRTFLRRWIYKNDSSLKKTGKHFDAIDIPEGGATI